jgi:hypothetical protein
MQLALPAGADDPVSSDRFMQDGVLVSLSDPSLAIKVDESFKFVGRHSFSIRDVAAGERFVFVDTQDQRLINRTLIVQFEGFLPGVDNFYRYDLTGAPVIAGYPFLSSGYAYNIIKAIAENPRSESAATYPFLESKGYAIPDGSAFVGDRSMTSASSNLPVWCI